MIYRLLMLFFSVFNVFVVYGMNPAPDVADNQRVGHKRTFESMSRRGMKNERSLYALAAVLPALVAHEKRLYGSPRAFGKPREFPLVIESTSCQEADQYHELSALARSQQYNLVLFRINNLDIPHMRDELMANRVGLANVYAKTIEKNLEAIPADCRNKAWQEACDAVRATRAEYAQEGERPQKAVRQLLSIR